MNIDVSLQEVERRAYRSTFQDGFYEILWGGLFLMFALIPVVESLGVSRYYCYPSILVLALIPWLGKRYITQPRLGAVEFGGKRKSRQRLTAAIGVIALVLMAPLVIIMLAKGLPDGLTWQTVALIAAPAITIGVLLLNYSRMYVYASLFIFSIVASEFLLHYVTKPLGNFLAFALPGVLILGYGIFLLVTFLMAYPRLNEEAPDVR
jgi:hypothetical protein